MKTPHRTGNVPVVATYRIEYTTGSYTALSGDSKFFERKQASQYYLQRRGRRVKTIKATTLTNTESLAVLDVHCCIEREHDTKAGPRVIRRNADDLRAVAADNGF